MNSSRVLVKSKDKNGKLKNPTLLETCKYFDITIYENKCHDGLYDANLTLQCYVKLTNKKEEKKPKKITKKKESKSDSFSNSDSKNK